MPATILVVDDSVSCRILARMLIGLGYNVVTADSGEAAVETVNKHPPFDLIFMDYIMPGMNGEQTSEVIKKLQPNAKIVLWSATPPTLNSDLFCGLFPKLINRSELSIFLNRFFPPRLAIDDKAIQLPLLPRAGSSAKAEVSVSEKENVILPPPVLSPYRRLSPSSSTASNTTISSEAGSAVAATTPSAAQPSPNSAAILLQALPLLGSPINAKKSSGREATFTTEPMPYRQRLSSPIHSRSNSCSATAAKFSDPPIFFPLPNHVACG